MPALCGPSPSLSLLPCLSPAALPTGPRSPPLWGGNALIPHWLCPAVAIKASPD